MDVPFSLGLLVWLFLAVILFFMGLFLAVVIAFIKWLNRH